MSKKHLIAAAAISSALLLGGCSSSSQTDLDDQSGTTVARTKNAALPQLPEKTRPQPGTNQLPQKPGSMPQPGIMTTTTAVAPPPTLGSTPQPGIMTTTTVAPSTSSTTTQATTTPTRCPVGKFIPGCPKPRPTP